MNDSLNSFEGVPEVAFSPGAPWSKFPGIVKDARRLGVSRVHLWAVLNGRRTSARLLRRYNALARRRVKLKGAAR